MAGRDEAGRYHHRLMGASLRVSPPADSPERSLGGGVSPGDGRKIGLAPLAILCVAAVLRLYRLGDDSLWDNEILSFRRATVDMSEALRMLREGTHPPGYSQGVLRPWLALGDGEFMQRFPSVVFGVAAVAVTMWVADRIAGRRAGLCAGVVLAVMPLHVYYSREGRMYAMLAFVVIAWSAALLRARERDGVIDWILYVGAGIGVLYTHYYGGFTVLAVVCAVAYLELRHGPTIWSRRWLVATGSIGVGFLPWLPSFLHQLGDDPVAHLRPVTPGQLGDLPVLFFTAFAGHGFWDRVLVLGALGASLVVAGQTIRAGRASRPEVGFAAAVVVVGLFGTVALSVLVSLLKPLVFIRYFVGILPLVAVLVGVSVARLRPVAVVAVGALLALSVVHTIPTVVDTWRPPFGEIADRIDASDQPGDVVVTVGRGRDYRTTGIDFYVEPRIAVSDFRGSVRDPAFVEVLEEVGDEHRVWVLQYGTVADLDSPNGRSVLSDERLDSRFLLHGGYRYSLSLLGPGTS